MNTLVLPHGTYHVLFRMIIYINKQLLFCAFVYVSVSLAGFPASMYVSRILIKISENRQKKMRIYARFHPLLL